MPAAGRRDEAVDIVVCVHDALDATRACLDAVARTTAPPYTLILVDDGSGEATAHYLRRIAEERSARLLRNPAPRGYTRAANLGIGSGTAPWLVLLNSDTIPTVGWLERMWAHGAADPRIGIIGPLSNCAAWQSAPTLCDGGDWPSSRLPAGISAEEVAALLAGFGPATVEIPFINGFCLMLRRRLVEAIGLFDEAAFGEGYGEEHDYAIRARQAGWGLVVATDAYVFHAGSRSYGHEVRRSRSRQAEAMLQRKHGAREPLERQVEACRTNLPLAGTRARLRAAVERRNLARLGAERWRGRRIAMVLAAPLSDRFHTAARQLAGALSGFGVAVSLLQGPEALPQPASVPVPRFAGPEDLRAHLGTAGAYDAVIAVSASALEWLPAHPAADLRLACYLPAPDPFFLGVRSTSLPPALARQPEWPDLLLLVDSEWHADQIELHTGRRPDAVGVSVDLDRFHCREKPARPEADGQAATVVTARLCPDSPACRAAQTLAALEKVRESLGEAVRIRLFGAADAELERHGMKPAWASNHGRVPPADMPALLSRTDIYLEMSLPQAASLTALEAMACGCAVVVPPSGGAEPFAHHLYDAMVVNTASPAEAAGAVIKLVRNLPLRNALQRGAVAQACRHPPEVEAARVMLALAGRPDALSARL